MSYQKTPSMSPNTVGRRAVLKSASAILAASAGAVSASAASLADCKFAEDEEQAKTEPLHERLVGYMLAHEQFSVPQLV